MPCTIGILFGFVLLRSSKRVDAITVVVGVLEVMFLVVAWKVHPNLSFAAAQISNSSLVDPKLSFLAAALIGATFSPCVIFHQQSSVAQKGLEAKDVPFVRAEVAFGAVLAQLVTASILVAAASLAATQSNPGSLGAVGDIAVLLSKVMGWESARLWLSLGVFGSSLIAAIVASLSLISGLKDLGIFVDLHIRGSNETRWIYAMYSLSAIAAAIAIYLSDDLVELNLLMQVINTFLLPFILAMLVVLSTKVLTGHARPHTMYVWSIWGVIAIVSGAGLFVLQRPM